MGYNKKYADWGKKIWFEIVAPQKIFNEIIVGETPAYKPEQIVGRTVDLNLAFLTGNFRYQNMKVIFQIYKVSGLRAYTQIKELALYDAYVRRIVRKGTSRIDDSFVVETKDGIKVRVKPMVITRYRAHRRQKSAIRKVFREYLINKIKELDYEDLIEKVINKELQNEITPTLNKIFPVQHVEIRKIVRETPIIQREEALLRA
ncbi:MAG TPA: 30S ribosomal protein S3ae [Candidatus Nanopusillus sp.]|nr:30S ribosomal protein S3ae [Candidatus Nanopusillus sp.]